MCHLWVFASTLHKFTTIHLVSIKLAKAEIFSFTFLQNFGKTCTQVEEKYYSQFHQGNGHRASSFPAIYKIPPTAEGLRKTTLVLLVLSELLKSEVNFKMIHHDCSREYGTNGLTVFVVL